MFCKTITRHRNQNQVRSRPNMVPAKPQKLHQRAGFSSRDMPRFFANRGMMYQTNNSSLFTKRWPALISCSRSPTNTPIRAPLPTPSPLTVSLRTFSHAAMSRFEKKATQTPSSLHKQNNACSARKSTYLSQNIREPFNNPHSARYLSNRDNNHNKLWRPPNHKRLITPKSQLFLCPQRSCSADNLFGDDEEEEEENQRLFKEGQKLSSDRVGDFEKNMKQHTSLRRRESHPMEKMIKIQAIPPPLYHHFVIGSISIGLPVILTNFYKRNFRTSIFPDQTEGPTGLDRLVDPNLLNELETYATEFEMEEAKRGFPDIMYVVTGILLTNSPLTTWNFFNMRDGVQKIKIMDRSDDIMSVSIDVNYKIQLNVKIFNKRTGDEVCSVKKNSDMVWTWGADFPNLIAKPDFYDYAQEEYKQKPLRSDPKWILKYMELDHIKAV